MTRDLSIHLENPDLPESVRFTDLLYKFGLTQYTAETYSCAGRLDVIITHDDCNITDLIVEPLSDPGLLLLKVPFLCPMHLDMRFGLYADVLSGLLLESPSKSCELDRSPSFLIKDFIDDLLPFCICSPRVHFRLLINELWFSLSQVLRS